VVRFVPNSEVGLSLDHSSTAARRLAGTATPSALAVRRLMTNSNFVGWHYGHIGRLSPLRAPVCSGPKRGIRFLELRFSAASPVLPGDDEMGTDRKMQLRARSYCGCCGAARATSFASAIPSPRTADRMAGWRSASLPAHGEAFKEASRTRRIEVRTSPWNGGMPRRSTTRCPNWRTSWSSLTTWTSL